MPSLATIHAAIREAENIRARRRRAADLDYERTVAPWLAMKGEAVVAEHLADPAATHFTLAEIAAARPAGKSASIDAVRKAIHREIEKDPVEVVKRGRADAYDRDWCLRKGFVDLSKVSRLQESMSR